MQPNASSQSPIGTRGKLNQGMSGQQNTHLGGPSMQYSNSS